MSPEMRVVLAELRMHATGSRVLALSWFCVGAFAATFLAMWMLGVPFGYEAVLCGLGGGAFPKWLKAGDQ
ncbi:MAG: hypothetical protein JWO67_4052 [Streptosporangiaceae bacterium]|nr:hypothetical protein [Streptosporangiaceae bacterium]